MVILLQRTTGSVPSFYLSMQVSPHLNLVSLSSSYLFKIHFLEVFFSDPIMDAFKHTFYTQKVFVYISVHLIVFSQPELLHFLYTGVQFSTVCITIFPAILTICLDIVYTQISTTLLDYNIIMQQSTAFHVSHYLDSSFPILCFLGLSSKSRSFHINQECWE